MRKGRQAARREAHRWMGRQAHRLPISGRTFKQTGAENKGNPGVAQRDTGRQACRQAERQAVFLSRLASISRRPSVLAIAAPKFLASVSQGLSLLPGQPGKHIYGRLSRLASRKAMEHSGILRGGRSPPGHRPGGFSLGKATKSRFTASRGRQRRWGRQADSKPPGKHI